MKTILYVPNKFLEKILITLIILSLIFLPGCSANRIERITGAPEDIGSTLPSKDYPYLKLHMKNGEVYVLIDWGLKKDENVISGKGNHLDINRQQIAEGQFSIPVNDIVLAETNKIKESGNVAILATLSIITGIVGIFCISNPKACFGSCPTFYINNGEDYVIQSEGFSASIAPALEDEDIDALYNISPNNDILEIQLRNEAMETHIIRRADLLALRKPENGRVYATPDNCFLEGFNLQSPVEALSEEGNIIEKIYAFDSRERFSTADSTDLSEKEYIDLTFCDAGEGEKGLVIASRQTLLTTFLIYQALAFMGNSAGEWIAHLERNKDTMGRFIRTPGQMLGSIEVLILDSLGNWIKVCEVGETGPIATDIKVVSLGNLVSDSELKIKLRMTKGLWRIDYLALADLGKKVEPILIKPSNSFPQTVNGSKMTELLINPDSVLVTFPGDSYFINYQLPEKFDDYEYFLQSGGYYLEWMREEWIAEENPQKVMQMFSNPKQFFKDLAPQFKKIEAEMEETFWSSKYVLP